MQHLHPFDRFTRRVIAWPPAFAGFALTALAGYLVRFAAWVMDMDIEAESDE